MLLDEFMNKNKLIQLIDRIESSHKQLLSLIIGDH